MQTASRVTSRNRLAALCLCLLVAGVRSAPAQDQVLVTVNGQAIRQSDLDLLYLVRRIPEEQRAAVRDRCLEELVDERLMAAFLAGRRTEASPQELDSRIAGLRAAIERSGKSADEELGKLGISNDVLRKALALPLAWQQHVRRVVTAEQLAARYAAHRARYDGTRRRVSQIVLTLPADADEPARQSALKQLATLKAEIDAGKVSFADAARQHSQSPSKEQGGDLGWSVYGARLPAELSNVAFDIPVGQVSDPFLTRFGAHLLLVTDEEPGDLSLEDVRGEVLVELGRELWASQLAHERAAASIVRTQP